MEVLSDRDVTGLLGFLHEANEVDGPEVFTESVVDAFCRLIPADGGVACNTFSGLDVEVSPEARTLVSFSEIETDRGHDAFLLDVPEFFEISRAFLQSAGKARGLKSGG